VFDRFRDCLRHDGLRAGRDVGVPDDVEDGSWMLSLPGLARLDSSLSSKPTLRTDVEPDENGIPIRPTWSVNELLSSYPKPTISPATLKHLYALGALIPPEEGSPEHTKLTEEIEDLHQKN
jgi:hypothetical protein